MQKLWPGIPLLCAWPSPVTQCVQPDTCSRNGLITSSSLHPGASPTLCLPDCVLSDPELTVCHGEQRWSWILEDLPLVGCVLNRVHLSYLGTSKSWLLPWGRVACPVWTRLALRTCRHLHTFASGVLGLQPYLSELPQCWSWMAWLIFAIPQS